RLCRHHRRQEPHRAVAGQAGAQWSGGPRRRSRLSLRAGLYAGNVHARGQPEGPRRLCRWRQDGKILMDLSYTPEHDSFRAEVREWLAQNVPAEPLEHFDANREGFEAHRAWEATLKSGDWGMVTWPKEYGGRGLDLISW